MDVFIERLWRSLKYGSSIYLHAFETGSELRDGLTTWIGYYIARRPLSMLAGRTPDEAYRAIGITKLAARRKQNRAYSRRQTVLPMGTISVPPI